MFDAGSHESFIGLKHWMNNLNPYKKAGVGTVLVANWVPNRPAIVWESDALHLSEKNNMGLHFISVSNLPDVETVFKDLAERIM